jgi:hypothetical protein
MDGRRSRFPFIGAVGLLLISITAACSSAAQTPRPTSTAMIFTATIAATNMPTVETFTDPFAYCASVGTVDAPDTRYTGTQIPDEIINGFKRAAGLEASTEPIDLLRRSTIWRCMDGKVYACNFGTNLPCDSKANTDRTPSPAMGDYCKANPNSDVIPMSVTGHATIYSWRCINDNPEILDQIDQVDAEGYLERIWYAIKPSP